MSYLTLSPQQSLRPWMFSEDFDTAVNKWINGSAAKTGFNPAVDVRESEEAYLVEADIPGLKKEDIQIEVLDDTVTVQGTRKDEREDKKENYHRVERTYGTFKRSFKIPGGFQQDKVKAVFADGVLRLTLPKQEAQKPKMVEVSGN